MHNCRVTSSVCPEHLESHIKLDSLQQSVTFISIIGQTNKYIIVISKLILQSTLHGVTLLSQQLRLYLTNHVID